MFAFAVVTYSELLTYDMMEGEFASCISPIG